MITNYESFVNTPNLLDLSEGVQAKLGIKQFANLFETSLFESKTDTMLLEKTYSTYELGLLYENRKDWFGNNRQIYMLESGDQCILFKDNSLFVISQSTYRILNEQLSWNSVKSAWNSAGEKAKAAINAVSQVNKEIYDAIGDGAKKAWEFSKKIAIAVVDFAKHEPLEAIAIFLQLMSGVVSFIPAAGQAAGPIMLAMAGGLDIVSGTHKIQEAWKHLSSIEIQKGTATSIPSKAITSFSAGAPMLIAGSVSILLGLNDIVTCPKAALPGVGATSTALRGASQTWSKTMVGQAAHSGEHFLSNMASKGVSKIGPKLAPGVAQFMGNGGTGFACGLLSVVMINVGKSLLGTFFDSILGGMSAITSGMSYLLSLPTKAADALKKMIDAAKEGSPIAKLLIFPLEKIVEPLIRMLGKFLDNYIKPIVDGLNKYLKGIIDNRKVLESYAKDGFEGGEQLVKSQTHQIKSKNIEVTKNDLSKIKQIKKEAKKNESLDHIQMFENFKIA